MPKTIKKRVQKKIKDERRNNHCKFLQALDSKIVEDNEVDVEDEKVSIEKEEEEKYKSKSFDANRMTFLQV